MVGEDFVALSGRSRLKSLLQETKTGVSLSSVGAALAATRDIMLTRHRRFATNVKVPQLKSLLQETRTGVSLSSVGAALAATRDIMRTRHRQFATNVNVSRLKSLLQMRFDIALNGIIVHHGSR